MSFLDKKYWLPFSEVSESMIVLSTEFEIIWANPSGLGRLNMSRNADDGPFCNVWQDKSEDCPVRTFFSKNWASSNLDAILANMDGCEYLLNPLKGNDGKTKAWLLTFRDAHRKKELEAIAQTSFNRFKAIFEEFPSALIVFDHEMRIKYCNRKFFMLFGEENRNILDKPLANSAALADLEGLIAAAQKLLDTNQRQKLLVEYSWSDDEKARLEVEFFPVRSFVPDNGEYCISISDITDYQRLHRDATLLYRAISESDHGMAVLDHDLDIIYANPAFASLLLMKDLIGTNLRYIFTDTTKSSDFTKALDDQAAMSEGFSSEIEWETDKQSGVFDFSLAPISLVEHGFMGYIVNLCDISMHKRYENWLQEARKMDSLYDLAHNFIHDFKNMLASIQGSSDMLRRKLNFDQEPGAIKYLDIIDRTSDAASDMLENLVRVRARGSTDRKIVQLYSIVIKASEICHAGTGSAMEFLISGDTLVSINGNESELVEVFMNLFLNSSDAMAGKGSVSVEWQTIDFDRKLLWNLHDIVDGPYIVISVIDNGPGIPNGIIDRIFEPFFSTKTEKKTRGLGLAIVYGIVRGHDGFLEVDSELGRGTTFRIYLPTPHAV